MARSTLRLVSAALVAVVSLVAGTVSKTLGQVSSPRITGYYEFYTGHLASTPPDFITGRNRVRLNGRYDYSVGSALASVRLTQSFVDPQKGGSFTAPKARLWEAYADFYLSRIDIRVGQQLIVWGQADGVFITDILSPLDLSEFLAQDFTDIRLPIPSVKAAYFGDVFSVTGVVTVVPTETIIPSESSPWFVVADLPETVNISLAKSNLPGFGLENAEPAVRVSYSGIEQSEFDLIYMYGFNRVPSFGRRVTGFPDGMLDVEIAPTYYRRHVIGLRWSTALTDPWVVDSETKYESRLDVEVNPGAGLSLESLSSNDLLSSTHHVQSMLGVERIIGDNFARLQLVGSLIAPFDAAVIRDRFIPSVTGYFRRSLSRETLFASLFVFYNVGLDAWINPAFQWSPGSGFNLHAGAHIFLGANETAAISTSAFSLYRNNDFFYVRLTQHF